jgi:hypothetical protein
MHVPAPITFLPQIVYLPLQTGKVFRDFVGIRHGLHNTPVEVHFGQGNSAAVARGVVWGNPMLPRGPSICCLGNVTWCLDDHTQQEIR